MKKDKNIYLNYFFYLIYILFHLFFINLFPTNFEFTFSDGFKFYEKLNIEIIENFYINNANTFAFSLYFGWLTLLLQNLEVSVLSKIISSLSYIFLIIGIINLCNFFKIAQKENFVILILLNPLVFILGFKGTPDLISTSLCIFALSNILVQGDLSYRKILNCLVFGLGITLKPINAGIIVVLFFYYCFFLKNLKIFKFLDLLLIFLVPLMYFGLNKFYFDFIIISKYYSLRTQNLGFSEFIYNFCLYLGYFSIMLSPFIFNLNLLKYLKNNINDLVILAILFFLGSNYLMFRGEMDLGVISQIIPEFILGGFLVCSIYLVIIFLKNQRFENYLEKKENTKIALLVLIFILIQIVALSLFRPTQRYLITILPFVYLFLIKPKFMKSNFLYALIIFIPINFVLFSQHYAVSKNTKKIIEYLKENDLLKYTNGGAIKMHAGNVFSQYNNYSDKYIITNKKKSYNSYLKKFEKSKLIFFKENYYLIKIEDL